MAKEQLVVLINQCKGDQIAAHDGSEGARVQANKGVEDGGCTPGNDAAAGLSASTLATEATPPPARRVGRAVVWREEPAARAGAARGGHGYPRALSGRVRGRTTGLAAG